MSVTKAILANNVDVNTIVKFTGLIESPVNLTDEIEELSGNLYLWHNLSGYTITATIYCIDIPEQIKDSYQS